MIVILILAAMLAGGVYLWKLADGADWEIFAFILGALGCLGIITVSVGLPIGRMEDRANIARYHAFKKSVADSRAKGALTDLERAAIQQDIAKWNQNLAAVKYWNGTVFDIFIVDELAELSPIE